MIGCQRPVSMYFPETLAVGCAGAGHWVGYPRVATCTATPGHVETAHNKIQAAETLREAEAVLGDADTISAEKGAKRHDLHDIHTCPARVHRHGPA